MCHSNLGHIVTGVKVQNSKSEKPGFKSELCYLKTINLSVCVCYLSELYFILIG